MTAVRLHVESAMLVSPLDAETIDVRLAVVLWVVDVAKVLIRPRQRPFAGAHVDPAPVLTMQVDCALDSGGELVSWRLSPPEALAQLQRFDD